jgi:hypothetical protein
LQESAEWWASWSRWVGLASLLAMAPTDIPRLDAVALDGTVLAFSAGVTLLSGLLFGLAPAFRVRSARTFEERCMAME